jgi:hypothetical protein
MLYLGRVGRGWLIGVGCRMQGRTEENCREVGEHMCLVGRSSMIGNSKEVCSIKSLAQSFRDVKL